MSRPSTATSSSGTSSSSAARAHLTSLSLHGAGARAPLGASSAHNTTSHSATGRQYASSSIAAPMKPGMVVNASRKAPPVPTHSNNGTGTGAPGVAPPRRAPSAPASHASSHASSSSAAAHREREHHRSAGASSSSHHHQHQSQHAAAPQQQQQQQQQRPATRLEREKKKEFSDPSVIGPWQLGTLIGTGASGRVRLARHSKTGVKAAVKIIPRNQLAEAANGGGGGAGKGNQHGAAEAQKRLEKMEIGIEREIIVMKLIKHDNLLSLIDVYETKKVLYLIMEYVEGGELFDHLVACGRLEVDQARNYFRQIMFGVDHCHSFNICHRDLKPENLLLSKDKSEVKVADFGMAALQHSGRMLETSCGSPHYASPEIVSGKAYVGTATDIWSCGIILFALLCGKLPFDDPHMHILLNKVKEGKFEMPKHLKDEAAKDLISKMLVVDPNRRYRMHDIFQHPWFTNYGKLSSRNPVQIVTDNHPVDLPHDLEHDDIFRGLTYLFQGVSKDELRRQLCDTNPNWPKKFYKLLHRNQAGDEEDLEEEDDEDDNLPIAPPPPPPAVRPTVSRTPSRASAHGVVGVGIGIGSSGAPQLPPVAVAVQPITASAFKPGGPSATTPSRTPSLARRASADAYSSPVGRAAAAAAGAQGQASESPLRTAQRPTTATATAGSSSTTRASFDGQRPNIASGGGVAPQVLRHRASDANTSASAARGIPSISVRGATPAVESPRSNGSPAKVQRANSLRSGTGASSSAHGEAAAPPVRPLPTRTASRPASPTKEVSVSRPGSLAAGTGAAAIPVPSIGNAEVQRFFQDIAAELASIRANSAGDGARTDRLQATLDHAVRNGGWLSPLAGGGATSPNANGGDFRFDDAEDDRSEAGSYRSGTDTGSPYTPTIPLAAPVHYASEQDPMRHAVMPLALPQDKTRSRTPSALGFSPDRRTSTLSTGSERGSTLSTRSTRRPGLPSGRPASVFSTATTASNDSERIHAYMTSSRPGSALRNYDDVGSVPYDQARRGPSPVPVDRPATTGRMAGSKLQARNPGLGLDIHSAQASSNATVESGLPPTPSSAQHHEFSSPRQASWFGSIFNFKPQVFTLYSIENHNVTLEVCKQLLQCLGCKVIVENAESLSPTLKCSVAEVRDAANRLLASKQVRFRVEFQVLAVSSSSARASPNMAASPNRLSVASPALSSHSAESSRRAASIKSSTLQSPAVAAGLCSVKVKITQEKGNGSTLKALHSVLRDSWSLDRFETSPALSSNAYSPSI